MSRHRLSIGRMPQGVARHVQRTAQAAPASLPRGVATATRGGMRMVLDVNSGRLERFDAATHAARGVLLLPTHQDPVTPGLVAIDARGQRALVMASAAAHGDAALVLADFEQGTATTVHATEGPGWVTGGFWCTDDAGLIACEQRLGDAPSFRLLVKSTVQAPWRTVLARVGMQQPCVPCGVDEVLLALLFCPTPHPMTLTGPSALCVVDATTGSLVALTPAEGTHVRCEEDTLVVDGGLMRIAVPLGSMTEGTSRG